MKVLQLALSLLIVTDLYDVSKADDNLKPFVEKKPFCNAFTGCGKKRDISISPFANRDLNDNQMPIIIYRALLRLIAAEQNNKQTLPIVVGNKAQMMQRTNALNQLMRPRAVPPF